MKKLVLVFLFFASIFACYAEDVVTSKYIQLKLRIAPSTLEIMCKIHNDFETNVDVVLPIFWSHHNCFVICSLADVQRSLTQLGANRRIGPNTHPSTLSISTGASQLFNVSQKEIMPYREVIIGHFSLWKWVVRPWQVGPTRRLFESRSPVCIGFSDAEGNIISPVVGQHDSTLNIFLAFIFNKNQLHELGFLLLNGSDETITIEKPLTQASCIVATAPAIDYTKELHIAGQALERIAIQPGKVGEWRIPWSTIHDLIPADDLTAIKAAGGDLDLVWRVGAYQSDPLPLSLAPPAVENGAVGEDNQQEVGR